MFRNPVKKALILPALALILLLPACSYQKILKNGSVDEKYDVALKLYNKGDYSRALQLFDQLSGALRATEKAQKVAFYYPYCYYNQKDYTLAAYYFKRYATSYPTSKEAEECLFMSAYCNFLNSPEYSLDQTVTNDALKELQLFTNTYPASKRVSECNELIDELRLKLEMKDYKIGRLYYRMQDFAACITVFSNILREYPETPHKEEIMYLRVKASYRYASESIFDKQKERHEKTLAYYKEFSSQFPESRHLGEAKNYMEKSGKELENIDSGKTGRIRLNLDNPDIQ